MAGPNLVDCCSQMIALVEGKRQASVVLALNTVLGNQTPPRWPTRITPSGSRSTPIDISLRCTTCSAADSTCEPSSRALRGPLLSPYLAR